MSSKHQVGTKLALSWHQVNVLLNFCVKEKSIIDIMKIFQWKDRTKFRKKFINPLLNEELIRMTIPDKPNSPKQKYIITEQGKQLLKSLEN